MKIENLQKIVKYVVNYEIISHFTIRSNTNWLVSYYGNDSKALCRLSLVLAVVLEYYHRDGNELNVIRIIEARAITKQGKKSGCGRTKDFNSERDEPGFHLRTLLR